MRPCQQEGCETDISEYHKLKKFCADCSTKRNLEAQKRRKEALSSPYKYERKRSYPKDYGII